MRLKIRAQILNRSEKKCCIKTLQHASFKNYCLFHIQIILENLLTHHTISQSKKSPQAQTFVLGNIKDAVFFSTTIYSTFTCQRPSSSNIHKLGNQNV